MPDPDESNVPANDAGAATPPSTAEDSPLTRVMALHAVAYCERLFYLEEVEEIRLADDRVFAGRLLHEELSTDGPLVAFTLESESLGIRGRFDAVKRVDGCWCVVEHKRGRSCKGADGCHQAWDSDRVQAIAYALLLAEHVRCSIEEVRAQVRYHANHRTVDIDIDEAAQVEFDRWRTRAHLLRNAAVRPPPTEAANRCLACSLAPICLPEEERLAKNPAWDTVRLFPADSDRITVHVVEHGSRVSRAGDRLVITDVAQRKIADYPVEQILQVVLHGSVQVTSQAIALCAMKDIQVHWLSGGGRYISGTVAGAGGVQRRIRQYEAMIQPALRLNLARRLIMTKVRDQLRHLLRVVRQEHRKTERLEQSITTIRAILPRIESCTQPDQLFGFEGEAAASYWAAFPDLILSDIPDLWRPKGRTRRPPRDAVNAVLSFCYQLLYRDCVAAILAVGLEPSLGFHHRPRSQAYPLAEDVMELFRVPLVDLPVIASLNRRQWTTDHAQDCGPGGWLLTDLGRKQAIDIYERRKTESWKHPVTGYSLSYARLIELEVRLLEKEYTGQAGLFARRNLR